MLILDLPEEEDDLDPVGLPEPPPRAQHAPAAEEIIAGMVDNIVARFDPLQIILFGSRARGTHRPGSDVDLLVIFPQLQDARALRVALATSLYAMPLPKDILVATPEDIAAEREFVGSVLETAVREGKLLYDRLALLTTYAVDTRYPDPRALPRAEEASQAVRQATALLRAVGRDLQDRGLPVRVRTTSKTATPESPDTDEPYA